MWRLEKARTQLRCLEWVGSMYVLPEWHRSRGLSLFLPGILPATGHLFQRTRTETSVLCFNTPLLCLQAIHTCVAWPCTTLPSLQANLAQALLLTSPQQQELSGEERSARQKAIYDFGRPTASDKEQIDIFVRYYTILFKRCGVVSMYVLSIDMICCRIFVSIYIVIVSCSAYICVMCSHSFMARWSGSQVRGADRSR